MNRIPLADRVLALEVLGRHAVVDDDGLGAWPAVGVGEAAAARPTAMPATSKNAGLMVAVPTRRSVVDLGAGRPSNSTGRRPTPNGGTLVVSATCSAPGIEARRGWSRS
jgi:hypothetical protein